METSFEEIINSYIETKVGIGENFLSKDLAAHLKNNLIELQHKKLLTAGGMGETDNLTHDKKVRGDSIYWLDRKHNDSHENKFFDLMDNFVCHINDSCYAGITSYEFHYAIYEKGTYYKKHIDQFQTSNSRQYSMISYLNNQWTEEDGGELCIHQKDNNQKISPTSGKTVFFKSNELEHEVLTTNQTRMSITGWLKK